MGYILSKWTDFEIMTEFWSEKVSESFEYRSEVDRRVVMQSLFINNIPYD